MTDPLVGSSPALDRLRALIERLRWTRTLCCACGVTYRRCSVCKQGVRDGLSHGCGRHTYQPCTAKCEADLAVRELVPVPPQPDLAQEIVAVAIRLGITEGTQPLTGPEVMLLLQEIEQAAVVPPAPSGAPEKCEHPRLAYIATEALARCPDCLFTFSEVQAANDEDPGGVAAPAPSGAKDPVKEPQ